MLDDLVHLRAVDAANLMGCMDAAADYVAQAWQQSKSLPLPDSFKRIERIVVAATGDSAAVGAIFAALVADSINLPIEVCRTYDLPAYADGQSTLILLLDHSGDLEETFSAFDLADARGTKVLALTSGGILAEYAAQSHAALWQYAFTGVARAALPTQLILLMGMVARLGLIRDPQPEVDEAIRLLREGVAKYGAATPITQNAAKRLAGQMIGRVPLIYGAGFMAAVARRWQLAIMQNAKQFALCDELPEMNHNTLTALSLLPEALRLATVCLAAPTYDHPRVVLRQELTRRAFMAEGIVPDTVSGSGESALAQALTTIQYGDCLSVYLAALNAVDPSPTPALDDFANRLRAAR